MIVDDYKNEMAAAKQYLRQSMIITLSDKPSSTDIKNSDDKEKFEQVCDTNVKPDSTKVFNHDGSMQSAVEKCN